MRAVGRSFRTFCLRTRKAEEKILGSKDREGFGVQAPGYGRHTLFSKRLCGQALSGVGRELKAPLYPIGAVSPKPPRLLSQGVALSWAPTQGSSLGNTQRGPELGWSHNHHGL